MIDELNIAKKIRKVLEDSEDEYEKPFESADELMQIKDSLEDKSLFLIQTAQETQKQYEETKRQYDLTKLQSEMVFNNLETRDREMQQRIDKTIKEF